MSAAATIEFGQLRSRVGPRRDGVVISVDVFTTEGRWAPVLKVDSFGVRPHWHIYARDGREIVMDLRSAAADAPSTDLEAGLAVVRDLATHLSTAGYVDLATWLHVIDGREFFRRIESEAEPFGSC